MHLCQGAVQREFCPAHRQRSDGFSNRFPHFIQGSFNGTRPVEQGMLQFIGEIEGVCEGEAPGQQPDGHEQEDFLPNDSVH